ncbi:hypothetical protein JCM19992_15980 [Thermostilla marina]|nr:MAG: hypothetical protein D6741_18795 [Planctomycetota bacterium]
MPRFFCVFGLVIAAVLVLVFGLDAAIGLPFGKASILADIGFIVAAGMLGFLSFQTLREQR